jgi:hypothetical protein
MRLTGIEFFAVCALLISCKDDKPSAPAHQAYAVTLRYQNYYMWFCIHLTVGATAIERCSLGDNGGTEFGGVHEWRLYGIDNSVQPERLVFMQGGSVDITKNMTCVVDGPNIRWY